MSVFVENWLAASIIVLKMLSSEDLGIRHDISFANLIKESIFFLLWCKNARSCNVSTLAVYAQWFSIKGGKFCFGIT